MQRPANETSSTAAGTTARAKRRSIVTGARHQLADGTLRLAVDGSRATCCRAAGRAGASMADQQAPVTGWVWGRMRTTFRPAGSAARWAQKQPLAMATLYIFPTENGLRCDTQALDWGAASAVISTSPFSHGAPVS